jgi:DNA-binding PadR family transcriptional regulator
MHRQERFFVFGPGGFGGPGGPGGPGGFGRGPFGGFGGPGGHGGRMRRRMRRGNVRAAILLLLEEEPRNGYQVMQEIEERSEGAWRPSPGSVYPAFQLLADEGLVRGETRDGGNVFELTDAGRKYVEENREQLGSPWTLAGEGVPDGIRELGKLMMQVGIAVRQVMQAGGEAQSAEAAKVLAETRRSLYRILAEDEPAED